MEAVAATAAPAEKALDADRAGDLTTFRELYQPHVRGVYDFALRLVRDRSLAAGVVRRTFEQAWDAYRERGTDVRDWLYAVAHDQAREAMRYRERRNGDEREAFDFTQIDADRLSRTDASFDRELVELVWDIAAELSLEEYSLLALEARHGIASENGTSMRTARLRAAFEERVTTELVVRRGRHVCAELAAALEAEGDQRSVRQHIRICSRCAASKRGFVSPTEVLRALAPMQPGRELEADLWRGLKLATRKRRRRRFGIL
jgi:DNA-directed RNA polymerase specialized sigma24 family protein